MKRIILIGAIVVIVCLVVFAYLFISGEKETSVVKKEIFRPEDKLIYEQGLSLAAKGENQKALAQWQSLVDRFPDSDYIDEALLKTAEIYLKEGNILEAEKVYKRIIRDYSNSNSIASAQKALGQTRIKLLFSPIKTEDSQVYEVKPGDTLSSIAAEFNTTVELLKKSNQLSSDLIRPGMKMKVPVAKYSLLVDKSQNVITLKSGEEIVQTYLISTGSPIHATPVGKFKITTKLVNPQWRGIPPENPKNILGTRWMGFEPPYSEYGIHGTTDPKSIGKNITQGCVRMRNSDIEELYAIVPVGSEVTIIE